MKNHLTNIVPREGTNVSVKNISHLPAIREIQADMREKASKHPTSRIFTMMGYLNAVIGLAAMSAEALLKEGSSYVIQPTQMREILDRSRSGHLSIAPCVTWLEQYFAKCWPRASNSKPSVYTARRILSQEFEIFVFEQKGLTPWRRGERKPTATALQQVDIAKALLLYEVLERLLKDRGLTIEEDFPEHRGAVMVQMFNWVFKGIAKFGRADELALGCTTVIWDAIAWFEDLFFVTSAIADNICSKINSAIMMDERSYFEADIPY